MGVDVLVFEDGYFVSLFEAVEVLELFSTDKNVIELNIVPIDDSLMLSLMVRGGQHFNMVKFFHAIEMIIIL